MAATGAEFPLPVYLPNVKGRDWDPAPAMAQVTADGEMRIVFADKAHAKALIAMAEDNILLQVAIDYRIPE